MALTIFPLLHFLTLEKLGEVRCENIPRSEQKVTKLGKKGNEKLLLLTQPWEAIFTLLKRTNQKTSVFTMSDFYM